MCQWTQLTACFLAAFMSFSFWTQHTFFSVILWFMDCRPNLTENFSTKLYCSCAKNLIDVATSHCAICHTPSLIFARCLRWMDHLLGVQLWIHQLLSPWWERCAFPGGSGKHRGYFCVPGRGQGDFPFFCGIFFVPEDQKNCLFLGLRCRNDFWSKL